MANGELVSKVALAKAQVGRVLIGQRPLVDKIFIALAAGGHVLVEGVPGLAKTLAIRAAAQVSGCSFSRIQFTPDLLPTDITGLTTFGENGRETVVLGPVFANFVLADEINRAPPKVQSALLEAMQERHITIGKETNQLPKPFFVMATQNPIESLGTYPLPYTQLDRFLFKVRVGYPKPDEEKLILDTNISTANFGDFGIKPVLDPNVLSTIQHEAAKVDVPETVKDYIVRIVDATRNPETYSLKKSRHIDWGVSARATMAMARCARANAFLSGRSQADEGDVRLVAPDILYHRMLIDNEGQADGVTSDDVIGEILARVE